MLKELIRLAALCVFLSCCPTFVAAAPDYCNRFDERLAPSLVAQSERIRSELDALEGEPLSTDAGRQLASRYLEVLARLDDSLGSKPLECIELAALPSEQRFLSIGTQMLFVTDRAQTASGPKGDFGAERVRSGTTMGLARVDLHWGGRCMDNESKRTWIWRSGKDPMNMVLPYASAVTELGDTVMFTRLVNEFKVAVKRPVHALVFVHGFNVSFNDALHSAAELAQCMDSDVLPIVVSWPSAAKMTSYLEDEEAVGVSRERLRSAVEYILSHPAIDEITVVAHSMGTRLVTRVLADLDLAGKKLPRLKRVAYAAADLDEAEFAEYWPRLSPMASSGWSFYVSKNDLAMWASTALHRRPRIGDSRQRVYTVESADTIEATKAAPLRKAFGHSYVIDSTVVSRDLRRWAVDGQSPSQRGLKKRANKPVDYWVSDSP